MSFKRKGETLRNKSPSFTVGRSNRVPRLRVIDVSSSVFRFLRPQVKGWFIVPLMFKSSSSVFRTQLFTVRGAFEREDRGTFGPNGRSGELNPIKVSPRPCPGPV